MNSAGTAEVKTAAEAVAVQIRALFLNSNSDGSGAWGDLADLMGLLVRLEFHDAITYDPDTGDGGADGCIDLLSPSNKGLREGIDLLEPIRLGEQNKAILSRADVWALAANIMIETAGGPRLEYKAGRVDVDSCEGHGMRHIEAESLASVEISEVFVDRLDFSPREVVALMGAHVLGRARENNSGYDGPVSKILEMLVIKLRLIILSNINALIYSWPSVGTGTYQVHKRIFLRLDQDSLGSHKD